MATTANERETLEQQMVAHRTEAQRRASRKLWWLQALTSLWAPITVLAIALVPYLLVVELASSSAAWAQPVMKGFGLLMLAWFVVLAVARAALAPFRRLRALRHEARELTGELGSLLGRFHDKIDPAAREKLVAQAAVVDGLRIDGEADRLEAELKKLTELADKTLATWRRNATWDFAIGLGKAIAVALLIRAVIIEPFRIPSGSMIPTLQVGDQIFVNKFIYGVRIPWMNKVPFVIVRHPERGDVIVFNNPVDTSVDYIKRVVGVPGDVIEIRNDVVYVNGQAQPRRLLNPSYQAWDDQTGRWSERTQKLFEEELTGHPHPVLQNGESDDWIEGPYKVPPGHVFVMGDNRDNSEDSRYGLGLYGRGPGARPVYVPYGNIKGKAMIVWLSLGHDGLFGRLFGGTGIRTERFFWPIQ